MNSGAGSKGAITDINVTPLVDVMLVLLIIFIIVTPAMKENIDVDLPKGKGEAIEAETENPEDVISVDKNRLVHAAGSTFLLSDAPIQLPRLFKGDARRILTIKAHDQTIHADMVGILSALRQAGIQTIRIQVDPREEEK